MATNSAIVMRMAGGSEMRVSSYVRVVGFYVRAVATKTRPFSKTESPRDAWEAYREEPVWTTVDGERVCLFRGASLSDAPRATVEEAAADMYRAIRLELERGARLVRGEVPEDVQLVGAEVLRCICPR
jgi:hypothetical protein